MRRRYPTLALLAITPLIAPQFDTSSALQASECKVSKTIEESLDASGATELEVDARAGFLRIEGSDSLSEVRIDGQACASKESLLDGIELVTRRQGDRLIVRVEIDNNWGWGNNYARLDLTLEVPDSLALSVDDSSGEAEIFGVASIDLRDSSGSIDIAEVAGDVRIRDSSGEIELRRVGGSVRLRDSSGGIDIRDVSQNVEIEEDGSGEIYIAGVEGDVVVGSDGSGGISIRDVTGHVTIGSDGSGSIRVTSVGGDFTVRDDGSGSISIDGVKGRVRTP
jgi:hypothetical protein